MATFPTVIVEADFTNSALNPTRVWTDISAYVGNLSCRRGRGDFFSQIEAGSLSMSLDNRDLRFDPDNSAGPYYSLGQGVTPRRPVRVRATYGALGTKPLWQGFLDEIQAGWMFPGYGEPVATAYDFFSILAGGVVQGPGTITADTGPVDRMNQILTLSGFSSLSVDGSLSSFSIPAVDVVDSEFGILQNLLEVAAADLGVLFVSADGVLSYHTPRKRFDAVSDYTPRYVFGNLGGTDLITDENQHVFSAATITNAWTITPSGGSPQSASDASSIDSYGRLPQTRGSVTTDAITCLSQAHYLLGRTKTPGSYIDRLTFRPSSVADGTLRDDMFAASLTLEIGDLIRHSVKPPGASYTVTKDYWVEGIEHNVSDLDWLTTLSVSPIDPTMTNGLGYWILGDATYGLLGQSTYLAL